jgi:hypothetical protein
MSGRQRRALLLVLPALLLTAPAVATSASATGVGPRSQALAGAGASLELGYESSFVNPAALGLIEQPSLAAGYQVTQTALYLEREGQPEERFDTDQLRATLLGFTLPLAIGGKRLVLGLASSSPGGFVASADLPPADQPQFPLLVSQRQALELDLALGLRALPVLALGAGLRALSTLSGTAAVERAGERTTTRVDDALSPVLAPVLGASAYFGEQAALSLIFRGPLRADFDVRLEAVDLGATRLPALNLSGVAHYEPLALELEYAHRFGELAALAGVAYRRYRDMPTLLPRTVDCPAERRDCLALDAVAPDFHDTFEARLAASFGMTLGRGASAALRAGYAYIPSPAPEQTRDTNLLDMARHRLGLGYGVTLAAPLPELELDFGAQLEPLVARRHRKPEGELRTHGTIVSATLGLGVRLQ